MKITQVSIRLSTKPDSWLATANIIIDDAYAVNGIRIIRCNNGSLQLQYPAFYGSKERRNKYAFKPIVAESHKYLERAILDKYYETVNAQK